MTGAHRRGDVHNRYAELVAAEVLDGLDEQERSDLAAHSRDCHRCHQLDTEFSETAADLALSLPPATPSTTMLHRLLTATSQPVATQGAYATESVTKIRPRRSGLRRHPRLLIAAAAAAIALMAAGGGIGYDIAHASHSGTASAIADYLSQPGARLARFPTTAGESLAVLYRPGKTRAWVIGNNVPDPSGGHVYELWYQPIGDTRMRPAGTFAGRTVRAAATLGTPLTALAVSVEPHGGSPQPTTQPVYLLKITS